MKTMNPLLFLMIIASGMTLHQASAQKIRLLPQPRNIIIMIGDGVGYNHILAANYYLGMASQVQENFPVRVAMAHYPAKAGEYEAGNPGSNYYATGYNPSIAWKDTAYLKRDFTESAAAATAMATGVKVYNNSIGMSVDHDTLENLVQRAKSIGKAAGVITTVEFCHATPAGFVAHNVVRTDYSGIAREMLLRSRCDVIMGCGDPRFDDNGKPVSGKWKDAKYVVDSAFWVEFTAGSGKKTTFQVQGKSMTVSDIDGDQKPDPWTIVSTLADFRALQSGKTPKRVLGCPRVYQTLQETRTPKNGETKNSAPFATPLNPDLPNLAEMTGGALNVLHQNKSGFFLMIEGGATDWASHSNKKGRLIEEMTDFYAAINKVVEWVDKNSNWDETMLIVTGDHETGLLWGDKPFVPLADKGKGQLPGMTFYTGDHSNSLIPLFAKGAGSDLFYSFADERDSIRGPFIQNSEIGQVVKLLWRK